MTKVHMTDEGPSRQRVAGHTFAPGTTHDVEDDVAESLLSMEHFEEGEAPSDDDEEPEESGPVESEDVTSSEWPGEDEWLDSEYEERVETVESGGADAFLDEIEDVERSQQVLDAVEDRRDEL